MAGVSIRKSIRWLPEDASEPTSTIVLSSAQRRFVDIRILKPGSDESKDQDEKQLDLRRLDWAIAGTSSSVAVPDKGQHVTLSTFHHWIDSRTVELDSATDEGYMYPMDADGGDELVLEVGNMVNPETGSPTDYEEIWIEKNMVPVPGDEGSQTVVLDYDRGVDRRGRVVRVGRLCQGLLRIKDEVTAERWEWSEKQGWSRSRLIGRDGALPCEKLLKSSASDTIEHDGCTWTIIERD
ncbi:uncharacterized protein M421DRAFT_297713 [Didymella exigua CBS 183.55]|uniref:Protein HRI1 n=1 Tax=Didymella exigua CBS 183.55 TaxID=1150837 RepID=A0A6A5RAI6_9PLEO|nr:uncharacterized protein M421DRAFT_297713 [Didymella exigua CBS 183.55]KAF1924074.1 hypothetical protein M421DRAFT_297713 [Didymella exigua CBS 183.55]